MLFSYENFTFFILFQLFKITKTKGCIFWKFCVETYDPKLIRTSQRRKDRKNLKHLINTEKINANLISDNNEARNKITTKHTKDLLSPSKSKLRGLDRDTYDLFFSRIL
jgi:hypothetical protein